MKKNSGLHLLYKDLGETPNAAILRYKNDNQEYKDTPMTYAGRLDPMAEGLLLVLSGDNLQKKEEYLGLSKTYEFEILWGFETDTLDPLGVQNSSSIEFVLVPELEKQLRKSVGKFEQNYPAYSSKPVSRKPLFEWARNGRLSEILIPSHQVEMLRADFISRREVLGQDLLKNIESKISLVVGDFRQKEILEKWQEVLKGKESEVFVIDKIQIEVSSGFYVRQLVSDLAKSLGTKALSFHIKRTKVGEFEISG